MNQKVCKRIKSIIHYNDEDPSSRRNYKRAKAQYNNVPPHAKADFLILLDDFYNKQNKKNNG